MNIVKRLGKSLETRIRAFYYAPFRNKVFRIELSQLPIVESGLDGQDKTPYAILQDGVILFGWPSNEFHKRLYAKLSGFLPPTITAETMGIAMDIITRYVYPHALPHITMPYSRRARKASLHRQHIETILDMPQLTPEQKTLLIQKFSPKPGETVLDLGAFLGYGTVRLAKLMGQEAKIVSIEADPDNLRLLTRNVASNKLSNVIIIPKAIWDEQGVLTFYKSDRQANSLIEGLVTPRHAITVEATTGDAVVQELGIKAVNRISMTLNGAEVEAVRGMRNTMAGSKDLRISLAGWYKRDGRKICDLVSPMLRDAGLSIAIGREGGVLAWK